MVYALNDRGMLRQVRACSSCARSAVPLVAGRPASLCSCGASATTCDACAGKEADKARRPPAEPFKAAAKKLRGLAAGYRASTGAVRADDVESARTDGRADGLEQAADILDARDY